MRLRPDGDEPGAMAISVTSPTARPLSGALLWRDRKFVSLSAGMALGLFAQIGLVAHLYSLLVLPFGAKQAGLMMGLVTVMAIAGRTLIARLMPLGTDRRLVACGGYAAQIAGSVAFMVACGTNIPLLFAGVLLFGAGFGIATSLPPLIAQVEFVNEDVPRVAALIVAIAQIGYSFAPAFFGLIRAISSTESGAAAGQVPALFAAVALTQCLAVGAFLAGRDRTKSKRIDK